MQSQPAILFDSVSKKFSRVERQDSLRDLIPALIRATLRRGTPSDLSAREFWAIKDVSFEVHPGEALGIIGPNGAGKSTALKLLTRILRPDRGKALVRGRVGALVEIAAGFHPDLTGRENVYMQGAIMGMKQVEIARKFDAIVAFAGVSDFIDMPVKRYSSGMNARLGFAVAAHLDPHVLLIDEVLAVGDLAFQAKCYDRMEGFARGGAAVAFVSHNLSAVSRLCTRVLVLERGSVKFLGPTEEALHVYTRMMQSGTRATEGTATAQTLIEDASGVQITEIAAGAPLTVRVSATGLPAGVPLRTELRILHLESGEHIFRAQSHLNGVPPVSLAAGEPLRFVWHLRANLGRGHYSVEAAIVNPFNNWVAVSGPALLTVAESQSERAMVYLEASCERESVPA